MPGSRLISDLTKNWPANRLDAVAEEKQALEAEGFTLEQSRGEPGADSDERPLPGPAKTVKA